MKLTPGKLAGMKAVSNERGIIAAAAMDQRGSLKKSLAAASNGKPIGDHEMEEFKALVTQVLTKHASAILLDPEWGLPAAAARQKGSGLLLAYEKTGYDATTPGRLPDLLDLWSVQRLKAAGADCIKILLYYNPEDDKKINDIKHAWVERIGDECRANDIPFFLEFVTYHDGVEEKSLEFAKMKPRLVTGAMQEFSKEKYGVDVLKVEVPVNMQFVEGTRSQRGTESAYTREEAKELFRKAAAVAQKPFIYLSAGVSNDEFTETLELATEAGTKFSGVLCGRATWKDGIKIYASQGADAFREWLNTQGVANISNVNKAIQGATPWYAFYGADSAEAMAAASGQ
jgi:tagatose 1,6-diphosphate aldolase